MKISLACINLDSFSNDFGGNFEETLNMVCSKRIRELLKIDEVIIMKLAHKRKVVLNFFGYFFPVI